MKIILDIPTTEQNDVYPMVGERYVEAGQEVTIRDERGRIAYRGTIDGYKLDGRASQRLHNKPTDVTV